MLNAYGHRIVVKPGETDALTKSGIILPESAKEKPQRGTITSVGEVIAQRTSLKVGDEILYSKYGGTELEVDRETIIILKDTDVLATIDKE